MWCKVGIPLLCAVIIAVLATLTQHLVWGVLFRDIMNDETYDGLWRPLNDPLWKYGMPFGNFVYGISFYIAFTLLRQGMIWTHIPFLKGALFGLIIWLFIGLTGGILWFVAHPVNEMLLIAVFLTNLIILTIGGGIVSIIVHKACPLEKKSFSSI